jgi:deoxycytidylate deaminase
MLLNQMREKFLIIGFTGPLRSGTTTAARFLTDEVGKRAEEGERLISRYQGEIESKYETIAKEKYLAKSMSANDALWASRKELLNKIKARQILTTLKNYKDDKPIYISMTDMLLKTAIELWWSRSKEISIDAADPEDKENCSVVIDEIGKIGFDSYLNRIVGTTENCVNNILRKRSYHELKPGNEDKIAVFEQYLSDIIKLRCQLIQAFNEKYKAEGAKRYGKILQDMGDNIRRCEDPFNFRSSSYNTSPKSLWKLSEQANDVIKFYKNRYRFWDGRDEHRQFQGPHIFIIENFRNPVEAEYFRCRYYEFFLISIHCKKEERLRREHEMNSIYKSEGLTIQDIKEHFCKIDKRDSGDENMSKSIFKQNVRNSVYTSDVAIINEEGKERFFDKILQYYTLIRNPGSFHPSNDELFMHAAYSMSMRSKCISRKVGAVIVGERGYIVGAGWNEVGEGQIGCGDRIINDIAKISADSIPIEEKGKSDFKTYLLEKYAGKGDYKFCFREQYENYLLERKKKEAEEAGELTDAQILMVKAKAQQYCRALHAEENAILQTAKIGGVGIRNSTIYTTTFPCELCAKKIYQSGISKIIYTEPYPEAISEDVFLKDGIRTILIMPFEGVKSHSYYRLYKSTLNVKDLQSFVG